MGWGGGEWGVEGPEERTGAASGRGAPGVAQAAAGTDLDGRAVGGRDGLHVVRAVHGVHEPGAGGGPRGHQGVRTDGGSATVGALQWAAPTAAGKMGTCILLTCKSL